MKNTYQKPKNGSIYPWKDWFKRKRWHLIKGQHFWVEPYVMAMQVRNAASRYGYSVSLRVGKRDIKVKVVL